jgi:cell wall-associated NlpC family hydrolase
MFRAFGLQPVITAGAAAILLVVIQACTWTSGSSTSPLPEGSPKAVRPDPSPTPNAQPESTATPEPTAAAKPAPSVAAAVVAYQTPGDFLKLDWDLQPSAAGAGFPLTAGMNGYKVLAVRQKLGLTVEGAKSTVDAVMIASVKEYQRAHGLEVDGIVGPITWAAMGFRREDWTALDAYVAPLSADPSMSRSQIVEALIAEAMRYRGSPYVWGGANDPELGADCSGMVLQAMYAVGLDPASIDTVKHAQPTYRSSRELYDHAKLMHVPLSERRRGDLLFYGEDGGRGAIYHVAIYLGEGKMIEETPPEGRITGVRKANLKPEAVRLLP